ncbi:MAG: metallophosphoesterase [Desulfobulbaceae bacterium]|nr:metallophosphoesterase [Desulfobulbaceae bacterium]
MTTNNVIKIAVISDLHAFSSPVSGRTPSYLDMSNTDRNKMNDPILGLNHLIEENHLKVDILLCAGDIGDKATPAATKFGWENIRSLQTYLGASHLIATAGNHDVDSRYEHNDFDAKGMLQSLNPSFPCIDLDTCDKYWSRNYAIITNNDWRIVTLNSAAFHGAGKDQKQEFLHGRVSKNTVYRLIEELKSSDKKLLNILLCHHHPIKNNRIEESDYSEMEGGDKLINALDSVGLGQWIIIHGHKHYPRITYAGGSSTAPVIFSAGSCCAQLYSEVGTKARNQFYIIEFPISLFNQLECSIAGHVKSWDWTGMKGWVSASRESGIPASSGFGYRCSSFSHLANNIKSYFLSKSIPYLTWEELVDWKTELSFLTPDDINTLIHEIKSCGMKILFDDEGNIAQLGAPNA